MTIATQADVEAVLLRPLTSNEELYISTLLDRADDLIYGELPYWKFDGVVPGHAADLVGTGSFEVWLPGRPVTRIVSVALDGVALTPADYSWHQFGDLARESNDGWSSLTGIVGSPAIWPRNSTVHVVWDYGLAAPPGDLVAVAADLVRVGITSPSQQGIQSQRFDDYAVTYVTTGMTSAMRAVGLYAYRDVLDHYRYPVAV